jgi:hypothetical protein
MHRRCGFQRTELFPFDLGSRITQVICHYTIPIGRASGRKLSEPRWVQFVKCQQTWARLESYTNSNCLVHRSGFANPDRAGRERA